jgi:hypothetical protein
VVASRAKFEPRGGARGSKLVKEPEDIGVARKESNDCQTVQIVERPFIALRFARRRQRVPEAFSHPTDDSLESEDSGTPVPIGPSRMCAAGPS